MSPYEPADASSSTAIIGAPRIQGFDTVFSHASFCPQWCGFHVLLPDWMDVFVTIMFAAEFCDYPVCGCVTFFVTNMFVAAFLSRSTHTPFRWVASVLATQQMCSAHYKGTSLMKNAHPPRTPL